MKAFFIKINLLVFLLFLSFTNYAQVFDTLYVTPNPANTDDSISVICKIFFTRTPSNLDSTTIEVLDSTVNIQAYYSLGQGSAGSSSRDTIKLGKLNSGNYKLIYNAKELFRPLTNTDSLFFTVNQVIGIQERNNPIQTVSVFPNPTKDQFYIESNLEVRQEIELLDITGKIILQHNFLGNRRSD